MKKIILGLLCLQCLQAFALTCTNEETPFKKIKITEHLDLASGEIHAKTLEHLLSGTIQDDIYSKTYTFYNQDGIEFTFVLQNLNPFPIPCRTRVCNSAPISFQKTGKLYSSVLEDEYYSCL